MWAVPKLHGISLKAAILNQKSNGHLRFNNTLAPWWRNEFKMLSQNFYWSKWNNMQLSSELQYSLDKQWLVPISETWYKIRYDFLHLLLGGCNENCECSLHVQQLLSVKIMKALRTFDRLAIISTSTRRLINFLCS